MAGAEEAVKWVVNRDEALVLMRDGIAVGGVWRGAWHKIPGDRKSEKIYGYWAAVWNPYERIGGYLTAREAKAAVEARLK